MKQSWAALLSSDPQGISQARRDLDATCTRDPWEFVTGRDPETSRPLVYTRDESSEDGYREFPTKEYLRQFYRVLHAEDRVFVEKSRQMIVSTAVCLYIMWDCLYHPARRWLISRSKEADAIELLRDKIRSPYSRLPVWFKELHPLSMAPQAEARATITDSYIQAVTENVANRTARGGTATGFFLDEAAFQAQAREVYQAASPMSQRIVVVSTPSLELGGQFMRGKIEEAQRGTLQTQYSLSAPT